MAEVPDVLTVEEAARLVRIGRTAAYQLANRYLATDGSEGMPVKPRRPATAGAERSAREVAGHDAPCSRREATGPRGCDVNQQTLEA